MGILQTQDEVTYVEVEEKFNEVDLNLFSLKQEVEHLTQIIERQDRVIRNLVNEWNEMYDDFYEFKTKCNLENDFEYVETISYIKQFGEEVEFKGGKYFNYDVKLKGFSKLFKTFIHNSYIPQVGDEITFVLKQDIYLRKVKLNN